MLNRLRMTLSIKPEPHRDRGTLTYDYSADNTLWPVNEQGDKLTNFLLTKDDTHANFDALSYKGQTYTYLSDLNKETGKQYLSRVGARRRTELYAGCGRFP